MSDDKDILGHKIINLHAELMAAFPELSRMAVAIYDRESDLLKTFLNSTKNHQPLQNYSAHLSNIPSLKALADARQTRVIDDILDFEDSTSPHTRWLIDEGFRSSYTVPMYGHEHLVGFLFFDADQPRYFDRILIKSLNVYAELITSVLKSELSTIYTLRGALNTARLLTHHRDNETALHLTRMSHYSYLIAQKLSAKLGLSDEFNEFILRYSPLHDIGKIGISDQILLKPGRLTAQEFETIKSHVGIGVQMIESILNEFDLGDMSNLSILRNIIGGHHEKYDGSGYPHGLAQEAIPLEARIVAVADVLDALSHPRPYKPAWSFDEAVDFIIAQTGSHFDPLCCEILANHREAFREIYQAFRETS
jgi:two-component system response regulator RpfG